jgi:hypothetical protein
MLLELLLLLPRTLQDHPLRLHPVLPHPPCHRPHLAPRPPKRIPISDRSDRIPTTLPLSRHLLLHLHQARASTSIQINPRLTSRRSTTTLSRQLLFNCSQLETVLTSSRSWLPFWHNVLPLFNSKFEPPAIPSQPLSLPCANIPIPVLPTLAQSSPQGWPHMLSGNAGVTQNHAPSLRNLRASTLEGPIISSPPALVSPFPNPTPQCLLMPPSKLLRCL